MLPTSNDVAVVFATEQFFSLVAVIEKSEGETERERAPTQR